MSCIPFVLNESNTVPYPNNYHLPVDSTSFYIINEVKSYTPLSTCVLEHILSTSNLSNIEKLLYILADNLALINANSGKQRSIALPSHKWATRLNCSRSQIFAMQKSLQEKGYFIIKKDKNKIGQNNRNIIIPTLPDDIFTQLNNSPDRIGEHSPYNYLIENKRTYLDRTKLFIKLNYQLLKIIPSNENLTSLQKILWLGFYNKCYKYHMCLKRDGDYTDSSNSNFSFTISYQELANEYSCTIAMISKAMNALEDLGFIIKNNTYIKQGSLEQDRQDKSLWQITLLLSHIYNQQLSTLQNRSSIIKDDGNIISTFNTNILVNSNRTSFTTINYRFNYNLNIYSNHVKKPAQSITKNYIQNEISSNQLKQVISKYSIDKLGEYANISKFYRANPSTKNNIKQPIDKKVKDDILFSDPAFIKFRPLLNKDLKINLKDIDNIDRGKNFFENSDDFKNLSELSVFLKNSLKEERTEDIVTVTIKPKGTNNNSLQEKSTTQSYTSNTNKLMMEKGRGIENVPTPPKIPQDNSDVIKSGKPLKSFYPLTEDQVDKLNSLSGKRFTGREYSTNFGNELLLKLSHLYPDKIFLSKNHMMSYMSKAFYYEKHQAPLVNHESFRFTVNVSDTESVEQRKIEKYLSEVEYNFDTSYDSQLRRKIAGLFEGKLSYRILTEGKFDYNPVNEQKSEELIVIKLPEDIELTYMQQEKLEGAVKAVYGNIDIIYEKIVTDKKRTIIEEGIKLEDLDQNSTWYKIRRKLKEQYGENIDKAWFSKLTSKENLDNQTIILLAPSNFIRDWINNKYGYILRKFYEELGYQFVELVTQ